LFQVFIYLCQHSIDRSIVRWICKQGIDTLTILAISWLDILKMKVIVLNKQFKYEWEKRETEREREVDECQINLFAYKHLQYIDVFIFKFLKKMKHTNGRREYCSNSMHISWLDSLRAIVVLFFSLHSPCVKHTRF